MMVDVHYVQPFVSRRDIRFFEQHLFEQNLNQRCTNKFEQPFLCGQGRGIPSSTNLPNAKACQKSLGRGEGETP